MHALANTATYFVTSFNHNIPTLLVILAILWGVQLVNSISGYALNQLGIYPRHLKGLIGILFSPFLHGSYGHLFLNSIPLFILTNFVLMEGWPVFISVTVTIMFIGGLLTWLMARLAYHIGASGIIMGYWGYLLVNAYYQQSMLAIVLALVCLLYFGSMWLNIFPDKSASSWEGHLFGLMAGVSASYAAPIVLVRLAQLVWL
ncbi:MAG: AraC family transcriptional regulator [Gammaproteobacteria bacterium]|jgi:membrane associated rhomboid family serine protease|nr:AraC family transcriptional regulator [Gammaproteobacteria bacterium]